ncbi:MAG: hypothetical protein K6G69_03605 [Lachnospiraceae bacterium]|nr:hypothetical protein [Lachnospiraceae bacterium]
MSYRNGRGKPETIAELKNWYADMKLPPSDVTRFYIGVDYRHPRAFGIYEDDGLFLVYKNKDDGSRVYHYRGGDEAYAVSELYERLKMEIINQRSNGFTAGFDGTRSRNRFNSPYFPLIMLMFYGLFFSMLKIYALNAYLIPVGLLVSIVLFVLYMIRKGVSDLTFAEIKKHSSMLFVLMMFCLAIFGAFAGHGEVVKYYDFSDVIICKYHSDYYAYDPSASDYRPIVYSSIPEAFQDNPKAFRISKNDNEWNYRYEFRNSTYYKTYIKKIPTTTRSTYTTDEYSDDDDDDYDHYDNGSDWDSNSTDWGSDW